MSQDDGDDDILLSGRLVGGDGKPVPGGTVRVARWARALDPDAVAISCITDADGRFAFRRAAFRGAWREECERDWETGEDPHGQNDWRADRYEVVGAHGERVTIPRCFVPHAGPCDLGDVPVVPGAVVVLTIADEQGEAVSDGQVDVSISDALDPDSSERYQSCTVAISREGRACLPALGTGVRWELSCTLVHPDFPRHRWQAAVDDVNALEHAFDLRAPRGVKVTGRVIDAAGRPITGLLIQSHRRFARGDFQSASPQTDADGRFELTGFDRGGGRIDFHATTTWDWPRELVAGVELDGVTRPELEWDPPCPAKPSGVPCLSAIVPPTGEPHLELPELIVRRPVPLRARVVDGDGAPPTSAHVFLRAPGSIGASQTGHHVDADGWVDLGAVAPGEYVVSATARMGDAECEASEPVRVAEEPTEVVVRVTGGGNLHLRFVDADAPEQSILAADTSVRAGREWHGYGGRIRRCTVRPGPGEHHVRIEAAGYEPVDLGMVDVLPDRLTVRDVPLRRAR